MSIDAQLLELLCEAAGHAASKGRPGLMCIAGNSGCGKSVLGKLLRKQGLGRFRPRDIVVIDDGVASVPFLGILRRRMTFRSAEKDHLRPFERYWRGRKLVVYVSAQPARRVDECDLLVEVRCAEALRLQQLRARNLDGERRGVDTAAYRLVKPKAGRELEVENDGRTFVLRPAEPG